MPASPERRTALAFGMLTAFMAEDREGYLALTDEFSSCAEALGSLVLVDQLAVLAFADAGGIPPADALEVLGQGIASQTGD